MWASIRVRSYFSITTTTTIIIKSNNSNVLQCKYHKQHYSTNNNNNNNNNNNKYITNNNSTLLSCDLNVANYAQRFLSDFHKYKKMNDIPDGIFKGAIDRFSGVTVNSADEYDGCHDFSNKLQRSVDYWLNQKRRCIWFYVQTKHSDWIPQLTEAGFEFHHARPGYAVLYRWLPANESSNLPPYAHTMLGVGGLVANDNDEILVISDRYALIPNSWKLPGGYVEPKENIIDAAIREVKEETGIISEFQTIISVRHSHRSAFNTSDLYFVVALKPKTLNITPCEREVAAAKWMPFEEYLQHPNVHETNRSFLKTFLDYRKRDLCLHVVKATHAILKIEYSLYSLKPIDKKEEEDN